jgi:hypothetical protein
MFDPAASSLAIVSVPRIPVRQLVLLRSLVDRLVAYSSEEETPEGIGDEEAVLPTKRSVRYTSPAGRIGRGRTPKAVALLQALLTEAMT